MKVIIKVKSDNERLDKYLSSNTEYSRALIQDMIEHDNILVNKKLEKASYKVKIDDEIEIKDGYVKELNIEPKKMDIDIVYEDDDIIVVNKASGVVVHPGSGNYTDTLVNGLMYYQKSLSNINGDERPGIVHRIDKDTSGLLLIAKNNKTHEILGDYFKNKKVKREYLALLCGEFPHNSATIDAPIGRDEKDRKKMAVTDKNSKEAITDMKVVKRFKGYTLVSCILKTGRTHQIRVHMAYIGYPIYNDPVYNTRKSNSFGQFLHSYKMDFVHPISGKEMHFECPLPKEFQDFLDTLEEQ